MVGGFLGLVGGCWWCGGCVDGGGGMGGWVDFGGVGGGVGVVGGEGWGWWVIGWGDGVVGSGWVGDMMGSGWGGGVHLIGKIIFVLRKNNMGTLGVLDAPHDAPMLFFDNFVKKLDNLSTSNIDICPSTMQISINKLLKLFFFGSGPPPTPKPYQRPPHPPKNHTYVQYFQLKPTYLLIVNV